MELANPESATHDSMSVVGPMTRIRWTICALLFFATTVNYLDRQLFSNLVPFFEDDLRLGPTDLALINVSFLLAYGFGMVFVGRFIDRVGTKKGLGITFLIWNVASLAHGLIVSLGSFIGVRFMLGLGEAGNFPACVKTVAEWFPKKERAYATGWFNSGANIGAILAPLLAVTVAQAFGWRPAFMVLGGIGIVWIFFWNRLYTSPHNHRKISAAELAYIESDEDEVAGQPSYSELFGMRPLYAVCIAKFLTDAPWWFYLTWLPKFLVDQFHLAPWFLVVAIPIVYLVSDAGSVLGGWISSNLIAKGASVDRARKTAMLICALSTLPVISVGFLVDRPSVAGIPSLYLAVAFVSISAAAHQGWSCNLFTLASDTLPKGAVAMAVGIMTAFGTVGAAAFQLFVGRSVEITGSYLLPFALAGCLYVIALVFIQVIVPRIAPTAPRRRVSLAFVSAGGLALLAALIGFQVAINKPPYASLSDYLVKRQTELKSTSQGILGLEAHVGWMSARWIEWQTRDGKLKFELIKFDRDGRPLIESKGAAASKYTGPPQNAVETSFAQDSS